MMAVDLPAHIASARARPPLTFLLVLVLIGASTAVCVLGYLALSVPGAWFSSVSDVAWSGRDFTVPRGNARAQPGALAVLAPDASGVALVSVTSTFRSSDFPVIAWDVDVPPGVDVTLLWRNEYDPQRVFNRPLAVAARHIRPVVLAGDPNWIGKITGIALALRGPFPAPVIVRGVVAKPAGALETLGDRAEEWLAFESWTGTSINTITGGADIQALPLPALLACIVGLAGAAVAFISRRRPHAFGIASAGIVAVFFLTAWLALDVRWTWNLLRQVNATAGQYAGKDARAKHLVGEDGPLYAFIEKSLKVLPPTPARVFVAADASYFRGRAAYHLYPHSVFSDPLNNLLPPAGYLRPGDWLLVYQRRGIEYDASQGKLRWDGGQTVSAELKVVEPGAALFLIR